VVVDSPRFDQDLDEAVRRFQARHHLEPDGLFGPASLRELNRPVEERMDQLRVNLDRARWLLSEVRGRFLLLDPAGGRVVLMDNSEPVLVLEASFAEAARSASEFRAELRFLVVNPDWTLPTALVQGEVAPMARRRPAELAGRGLEVFDLAGQPLDPARADWSRPERLVVRQRPAEASFLGPVRFSMPNPAGLFLHGGSAEGAMMDGSVRLREPLALARALAGPPPAWTAEQLAQALGAPGTPRTFPLAQPLPVLFAHWTAWVQSDGVVHFRAAHAGQDAALLAGLLRSDESE
jgi:L,D-transpeptidase YcbB